MTLMIVYNIPSTNYHPIPHKYLTFPCNVKLRLCNPNGYFQLKVLNNNAKTYNSPILCSKLGSSFAHYFLVPCTSIVICTAGINPFLGVL